MRDVVITPAMWDAAIKLFKAFLEFSALADPLVLLGAASMLAGYAQQKTRDCGCSLKTVTSVGLESAQRGQEFYISNGRVN